jgi:hypothetical protein
VLKFALGDFAKVCLDGAEFDGTRCRGSQFLILLLTLISFDADGPTLFHHPGQCITLIVRDYNCSVPFATGVSWFDPLGERFLHC